MERYRQAVPVALAIAIFIVLQALLILGDRKDTPGDAVIAFSKAYFMLDPSMGKWLCSASRTIGGVDGVAYHLAWVDQQARERGFSAEYMKNRLDHIRVYTLQQDEKTAKVRLTAMRRFAMNPLYALVGQIFGFTRAHEVEETLTVVKEGNRWKVCEAPYQWTAGI